MKKLLFTLLLATQFMFANNLNITNVTKVSDNSLSFDVSWDNSWWVSIYRDASWVFIKYKNSSGQWQHLDLTSATASGFTLYTYPDNKGVMISRATSGTGTVTGTLTVDFNGAILGPLPDFKVFGVEMVYINQGAFYVGDGVSNYRFYKGNDNTQPYYVIDSNEITFGNTANDIKCDYGLSLNIPATFPNGFDAFYMIKYEITQEQYTEFLNTLTALQQQNRTETDLSAITSSNRFVMKASSNPIKRSGIACDSNATNTTPIQFYCDNNNNSVANESDDGQNIAANYLSVYDCLAYLDWSALRPITELEYEKSTRGANIMNIGYTYANGTNISVISGTIINTNSNNETVSNQGTDGLITSQHYIGPIRVGCLASANSTRLQSGAGFYGAMELSGNLLDLTITTTNSNLSYIGTFGDGSLSNIGENNSWNFDSITPKGSRWNSMVTSISFRSIINTINMGSRTYTLSPRGAR